MYKQYLSWWSFGLKPGVALRAGPKEAFWRRQCRLSVRWNFVEVKVWRCNRDFGHRPPPLTPGRNSGNLENRLVSNEVQLTGFRCHWYLLINKTRRVFARINSRWKAPDVGDKFGFYENFYRLCPQAIPALFLSKTLLPRQYIIKVSIHYL